MTHEAMHGATRKIDGATVVSSEVHEASVLSEKQHFLGAVAADLVVVVAASSNPEAHMLVARHFSENVDRMLSDVPQNERDAIALNLVKAAHGPAQAQMAQEWKAAEAKNALLLVNLRAALESIRSEVHPDVLNKFEQRLYAVAPPISESPLPSTAELNASIENLTDETVSPPRGLAIDLARKAGLAAIVLVTRKLHR
jgi:hypothetical protein